MNHFRTIVRAAPSNHKIGLINGVFTIGSCFAEAIGSRLQQSKFNVAVNPFGTSYNPLSIHKIIQYALRQKNPTANSYVVRDDIHLNFDFHSTMSSTDKTVLENSISNAINSSHDFLKSADRILITYGTAWIYSEKSSGFFVNNCHKVPANNFTKRLVSAEEIADSFNLLYEEAKKLNPALKFILTVSPVRHIKDTLELNSVSKAVLRSACHSIVNTFSDVDYFPAYEVMMDDLRDYRFYKSDMLHPTEEAEDYIWENFKASYFDPQTKNLVEEWTMLQASLNHKPFHPKSHAHQKFLKETLKRMSDLRLKINIDAEIEAVKSQIINP
jgi:hypothetical protein